MGCHATFGEEGAASAGRATGAVTMKLISPLVNHRATARTNCETMKTVSHLPCPGRFRSTIKLLASSTALLFVTVGLSFAQGFFQVKDVRPGQHGIGRTVFHGNRIEEFQVEILGVLENLTPKQSIILAKLSGGPLEETGVMQGMSGSPVYIDGKLLGAVALGFPFSKQPIAGIQPIEQMIADSGPARQRAMNSRKQRRFLSFEWKYLSSRSGAREHSASVAEQA